MVPSFPAVEPPSGILAAFRECHGIRLLQHGQRPCRAVYRPQVAFLRGLVSGERGSAKERARNGSGGLYRAVPAISGADQRCRKECEGRSKAGCADIQPDNRDFEDRAAMKRKCARLNPLILQSLNPSIRNQRITTNQLINQSRLASLRAENIGQNLSFACCRANGGATQKLKPQGAECQNISASGILLLEGNSCTVPRARER